MSELLSSIFKLQNEPTPTLTLTLGVPYCRKPFHFFRCTYKNLYSGAICGVHAPNYYVPNGISKKIATDCGRNLLLNNISVGAVFWYERKISIRMISKAVDAVSFDFSGCAMACFEIKGMRYVAHIHLREGDDCRKEWNNFVKNNRKLITKFVMFIPDDYYSGSNKEQEELNKKDYCINLLGVISADWKCYSVVLANKFEEPIFQVVCIKKHYLPFKLSGYDKILGGSDSFSTKVYWDSFFKNKNESIVYLNKISDKITVSAPTPVPTPVTKSSKNQKKGRGYKCGVCNI